MPRPRHHLLTLLQSRVKQRKWLNSVLKNRRSSRQPLSAGEQSPPKSEDGEKTQEAAASTGQPDKTDVDEKAAQDVQPSADVSEVPGEASVTDSESAKEENVPNHVGADGGASAKTQEGGDSAKNEV